MQTDYIPPKSVLLTGGSGYLGRDIFARLRQQFQVRVLDTRPLPGECDFVPGSVADAGVVRQAMRGMEALVIAHMAPAQGGYDTPELPFDINVKGTAHLFDCAREQGIRRVVLISSTGVCARAMNGKEYLHGGTPYGPTNMYSLTKVLQEMIAQYYHQEHGFEICILRPSYILREDTMRDKYGRPVGEVNAQAIDPRDIAEAVAAALCVPRLGCETFPIIAGPGADRCMDLQPLRSILGWKPKHDFSAYPQGE